MEPAGAGRPVGRMAGSTRGQDSTGCAGARNSRRSPDRLWQRFRGLYFRRRYFRRRRSRSGGQTLGAAAGRGIRAGVRTRFALARFDVWTPAGAGETGRAADQSQPERKACPAGLPTYGRASLSELAAGRKGRLARPDCPQPRFALDAAVLILAFARHLLGDRRLATTVSCRFPHRNAVLVARLKRCLHINRATAESYTACPPAAMPKRLEESHCKKHNVSNH